MKGKTIYYSDELSNDFANTSIKTKPLGKKFKYVHKNIVWRVLCFLLYYIIAIPLVFIINKLLNHQKFKNKKVLKSVKNTGYFIFCNHSSHINDCFANAYAVALKRNYIVCNPDATSIPMLRNIVQMLGAIPLGSTYDEKKAFIKCINYRIKQKQVVTIFPEAHIWPFYTKIRNYPSTSFKYAVKLNVPSFCITHCYQKRRIIKRPKIVSYIDGPFYINNELNSEEATIDLRNRIYQTMCERAKQHSTYEYYHYEKK